MFWCVCPPQVLKKERAVGVVPTEPTIYEVLEELAITVQNQLSSRVPFCAFNGASSRLPPPASALHALPARPPALHPSRCRT